MIEIKELTKVYKSKKGEKCVALDRVSFSLPDKGLVFIVGKSGSGKSTLLNLIGGLDEITSGEIVVDGVNFSDIKGKDGFDAFRNSYMGFVFQDYYLIDSLNVFDNVKFALDLKNENNENKVNDVLNTLGISDLALRSPKELSGGQQQRVAIARAIVKNPTLILADEPTGNLDELSSTQILEILKDLSKNSLVLIVSHNLYNAKKYADRIIRLERGKITSDMSRSNLSQNRLEIKKDEIVLPNCGELTDLELEKINNKINEGGVKISQQKPAFVETVENEKEVKRDKPQFASSHLSLKMTNFLAAKFTRLSIFNFIASSLIVAFLLVLFGICQALYAYDGRSLLQNLVQQGQETVVLQKAYQSDEIFKVTKTDRINRVTQQDLDTFRENGYDGNMYLLYNDAIAFSNKLNLEKYKPIDQGTEYRQFYAEQAFGTLRCDEQYLSKIFGNGSEVSYYGDPYSKPYGVIITDYMADCILYYDASLRSFSLEASYNKLLGSKITGRFAISAIIKTDYREKYQELFDEFLKISTSENPSSYAKEIYSSEDFFDFVDEARLKLNMAYVLSDDYFEETRRLPSLSKHFIRFPNLECLDDNGTIKFSSSNGEEFAYANDSLEDDEIIANEDFFKQLYPDQNFGDKTYEVTIKLYDISSQEGDSPCIEKVFKIKALENTQCLFYVNTNNFAEFRKYDVFPYAILFDNVQDVMKIHETGEEIMFVSNSPQMMSTYTIVKAITMYKDVFLIIAITLSMAGFLILVNFGRKNVRGRTYEIGVIRALGGNKNEITKIFILQMLLACISICAFSTGGMFLMIYLVNEIMSASLFKFSQNPFFKDIKLLSLNPLNFVIILSTVIIISIAAFVVPLVMLNRIKPINIIKNRE